MNELTEVLLCIAWLVVWGIIGFVVHAHEEANGRVSADSLASTVLLFTSVGFIVVPLLMITGVITFISVKFCNIIESSRSRSVHKRMRDWFRKHNL